jgi:hypothetical protein
MRIVLTVVLAAPAILFGFELHAAPVEQAPAPLVGSWQVTVNSFVQAPDAGEPISVGFRVQPDGTVGATVGQATSSTAPLVRARGPIGRVLGLASDFVVRLELDGAVRDDLECERLHLHLTRGVANELEGALELSGCRPGSGWLSAPVTFVRGEAER